MTPLYRINFIIVYRNTCRNTCECADLLSLVEQLQDIDCSGAFSASVAVARTMRTDFVSDNWFAVQVRSRRESYTAGLLSAKGYQTLLPTYKIEARRETRVRNQCAPLFSGYLFCQFDVLKRLPILVTPGVIGIVGNGRTPIPLGSSEISAIQALMDSGIPARPWPYLDIGQRVRIEEDSALCGVEGILVGFKGSRRIVVSVPLLRRSIALEIDRAHVSPIGSRVRELFVAEPQLEEALA